MRLRVYTSPCWLPWEATGLGRLVSSLNLTTSAEIALTEPEVTNILSSVHVGFGIWTLGDGRLRVANVFAGIQGNLPIPWYADGDRLPHWTAIPAILFAKAVNQSLT